MTASSANTTPDRQPAELYLVTPVLSDVAAFLPRLEKTLSTLPASALLLRLAPAADSVLHDQILKIRQPVQDRGIALMLDGHPALARQTECDGAHVDAASTADARRALGDSLQLGAFCGTSRDIAMQAGEKGADYIAFGPFAAPAPEEDLALLRWWSEMMELPVVADCTADTSPDEPLLRQLSATADFIALGRDSDQIWTTPDLFRPFF